MSCSCDNNDEIVTKIAIPDDISIYIERLYYEYVGLQVMIKQFTLKSEFELNMDTYNNLLKEYLEAYIAYNIAFDNIMYNYAIDYRDYNNYNVYISFQNDEIVVKNK